MKVCKSESLTDCPRIWFVEKEMNSIAKNARRMFCNLNGIVILSCIAMLTDPSYILEIAFAIAKSTGSISRFFRSAPYNEPPNYYDYSKIPNIIAPSIRSDSGVIGIRQPGWRTTVPRVERPDVSEPMFRNKLSPKKTPPLMFWAVFLF